MKAAHAGVAPERALASGVFSSLTYADFVSEISMCGELLPGHEFHPDVQEVITEALVSCVVMCALGVFRSDPEDQQMAGIDRGNANAADDGVPDEFAYLLGRLPKRTRKLHELTYRQLKLIRDDKIVRAINHRLGRPLDSPLSREHLRAIADGKRLVARERFGGWWVHPQDRLENPDSPGAWPLSEHNARGGTRLFL